MRLTQIIEALLFASESPLSAADLSRVDERLDEDTVEAVIQELRAEYELNERSFQIYEVAGGYQLLTRPEFVTILERYDSVPQPSRLSAPALEVLAILAYRQPLGRAEVEEIRGVGSSGVLRTLTERQLIEPVARGEGLGRPLLYGTTKKFLEHFGFRSLEDLPRPDELPIVLRDRTTQPFTPLEDAERAAEGSPAPPSEAAPAEPAVAGTATEVAAEEPSAVDADAVSTDEAASPDVVVESGDERAADDTQTQEPAFETPIAETTEYATADEDEVDPERAQDAGEEDEAAEEQATR